MFYLALQHLISRPRQSILTLMGVGLGTAAFVTFTAVMTGFQDYIIEQLVNNDAHVKIQAQDEVIGEKEMAFHLYPEKVIFWQNRVNSQQNQTKINYPLGWFERLKNDPYVQAYSPQLLTQVIFSKGGVSVGGRMTGVIAETQTKVTNIEKYMVTGSFKSISNPGQRIIIGKGLSEKMGVRVGETLNITTGGAVPIPFKVSGIFDVGVKSIDEGMVFAHLNDVQQAASRPSEITDIVIRLHDVDYAHEFTNYYSTFTKDKVLSWDQANAGILSVFSFQNFIRNFITISILIVASFGIYNILNILVNQKRKDIGILRSMGFDRHDISKLFLIQGIILGLIGGACGIFLGYFMGLALSQFQIGGMVNKVMVSQSPQIYVGGFFMALGASTISSFLPARAASLLRPIDIVRSGD
jgi:lipoprotein-releasing system permease protein